MYERNDEQAAAPAQAPEAPSHGGSGRGDQLRRQASQAGDFEAQENALRPDSGLLTPDKASAALGYNARRARRQGEPWIQGLQSFVGAPPSGADRKSVV